MSQDRIGGATNPETAQAPHTVDLSAPPGDKTVITTPGPADAGEPQKTEPAEGRTALPLEKFVQHVVASGLIAERELETLLAGMTPPPKTAEECARELIRRERLTRFQAQVIAQGKGKALTLGNYVFLDKIGAGGMGQVYKARHRRMQRTVAIKTLPVAMMKDPKAIARFQREVQAAARLSHPNVVTAHDCDEHAGVHFLVMEYVAGTDLHSLVKQHGRLPVDQAVDCIRQAARGLAYAHAAGVLHRDIKPSNLLLDKEGKVKILDLGLARLEGSASEGEAPLQESLTATGAFMGTVAYMSPEQALDTRHADARSDIYSLGCTLWYLLTAQPLYAGDTVVKVILAHRERPIPSLAAERSDAPAALETILGKMVAKQPEERYASMTDLLADLDRMQSETEPAAEPEAREFLKFLEAQSGAPAHKDGTGKGTASVGTSGLASGFLDENLSVVPTAAPPRPRWSRRRLAAVAGGMAAIALLAAIIINFSRPEGRIAKTPIRKEDNVEVVTDEPSLSPLVEASDQGNDLPPVLPAEPITSVDYVQERAVAEWVLSIGGTVTVGNFKGESPRTVAKPPLPPGDITVTQITLPPNSHTIDNELQPLGKLAHLWKLDLDGNSQITDAYVANLEPVKSLTNVVLKGTRVTDRALKSLAMLPRLEVVDLTRALVTDAGLAELARCSELKQLRVSSSSITIDGLRPLAKLKLSLLYVSKTQLRYSDLPEIVRLFPDLDSIDFKEIIKDTETGLSPLADLPFLKKMYIDPGDVTPDAPHQLRKFSALRTLALYRPDTALSADFFDRLSQVPQVESLQLNEARLDDDALPALARIPTLQTLTITDWSGGDVELMQLVPMAGLKTLYLSKTQITAAGVEQFHQRRPNVKITGDFNIEAEAR